MPAITKQDIRALTDTIGDIEDQLAEDIQDSDVWATSRAEVAEYRSKTNKQLASLRRIQVAIQPHARRGTRGVRGHQRSVRKRVLE